MTRWFQRMLCRWFGHPWIEVSRWRSIFTTQNQGEMHYEEAAHICGRLWCDAKRTDTHYRERGLGEL